jgi:hypothetical protein
MRLSVQIIAAIAGKYLLGQHARGTKLIYDTLGLFDPGVVEVLHIVSKSRFPLILRQRRQQAPQFA